MVLTIAMLLTLVVVPASAAGPQVSVALTADKTTVQRSSSDQEILITVTLNNPAAETDRPAAIGFDLKSADENVVLAEDAETLASETFTYKQGKNEKTGVADATYTNGTYMFLYGNTSNVYPIQKESLELMTIKATIKANAPVGEYTISTEKMTIADTGDVGVIAKTIYGTNQTLTINVVDAITSELAVAITAPEKGKVPQSDITATENYTGSITWEPTVAAGGKFAADTEYTANVTLTAKEGYQFASGVTPSVAGATISGKSVTDGGKTLTFKATFDKTDTVKVTKVEIGGAAPTTLNVPEAAGINTPRTVKWDNTYSVTVHTDSDILTNPDGVKWSVSGLDGVTVDPDTGDLTISSNCPGGKINLTATYGGVSAPKPATPTVFRADPAAKWLKIVDKKTGGAPQTTIIRPVGDDPTDTVDVVYEAKVYDQFSKLVTIERAYWTLDPMPTAIGAPVTVNQPIQKIHVTKNTQAIPFELTAALETGSAIKDTVNIEVVEKTLGTLTVTQADTTYGTPLANPVFTAPDGTIKTTIHYSTPDSPAYSSATPPTDAGEYVVNVLCETATHIYMGHDDFKIERKSISGMTVTLDKTSLEYNGSAQTVNVTGVGTLTDADYTVTDGTSGTNVGSYTVKVTGKGNYKDTATATWKITQATPTYTVPTGLTAKYGQTLANITLPTSWSWMDSTQSVGDASTAPKTFKAKFTPTDTNYKTVENIDVSVTVDKADGRTLENVELEQKYTDTSEHTYAPDWSGLPSGQNWSYNSGYSVSTGSVATLTKQDVAAADGGLTYAISGGKTGDKITITLKASCDNYEDYTITLVITLTAKDNQAALTLTGGTSVVYGQTLQLGTSGGSGTGAVTYAVTNGTGEATIDAATGKLTPTKVGTVKVKATKAGDASYNSITSAEVEITIKQATPTGEPAYTEITTSGKTLTDASLTKGNITPDGTIKWNDAKTTVVEANKSYGWTFTPTDTTNYKPLTGTIKLWNKSTSSGGYYYAPTVPDMPMLYRGCTGDAVKTLQDKLNALGYNSGNVDGIFGAKTYAAVTAFQKANSLGVDGIVGKLTWGKLYGVSPAMPVETTTVVGRPTVSYGSRGDAVRKLQELLNALGYDCGSVDGIFGSKTKAAVLAFQKANGLGVDGIVGPLTWAKLG